MLQRDVITLQAGRCTCSSHSEGASVMSGVTSTLPQPERSPPTSVSLPSWGVRWEMEEDHQRCERKMPGDETR